MIKLTKDVLIDRFKNIHKNEFDYSLVEYKCLDSKIKIICSIHGIFEQTPRNHLLGNSCFECSKRKKSKTNIDFIIQAKLIHNNFYDYSLTNYKNYLTKVKIICPIHGEFEQLPQEHIFKKSGCKKCGTERTKKYTVLELEKFKEKAGKLHNNKYNYDKVIYINSYSKIEIVCPKHGSFFQKPGDHIHSKSGCPICKESKGEKAISKFLTENNIKYEYQKTFSDLKHKTYLFFDFYLPELNTCIEFDGEQHFKAVEYWGGEKKFKELQHRDKLKNQYCKKKNILLLRIDYKSNVIEKLKNLIYLF